MRSPSAVDASHDPGLNASRSALKPRRLRAVQFTNKVRSVTFTRFWLYASLTHHRHAGGLRWPSGRHGTAVASEHDAGHHRSYTAHRPAVAPSALVSGRVGTGAMGHGNRAPPEMSTHQESIHRDRITYHKHVSMSFRVCPFAYGILFIGESPSAPPFACPQPREAPPSPQVSSFKISTRPSGIAGGVKHSRSSYESAARSWMPDRSGRL